MRLRDHPLVFALLALPCLLAAHPPEAGKSVGLVQGDGWQREETALLYALRIYTRDLKIPITISVIPSGDSPEEQQSGAKSRCALDAALVARFVDEDGDPNLFVLRCSSGEEYRLPLRPARDRELAAQTLALKIRGLLMEPASSPNPEEKAGDVQQVQPYAQPALPSKPAPLFEAEPGISGDGVVRADAISDAIDPGDEAQARPPAPPHEVRPAVIADTPARNGVEGGLEWLYGASNDFSRTRQGLLLRLALTSPRLPAALEVDGAVVTSVADENEGYQMTVSESPIIGAALSARLSSRSWTISIGPRMSLHRVQASGRGPGGRTGSATTVAMGVGALERILYHASKTVSFGLSLSNEALVPRQRFMLDGQPLFDNGRFQWALSAGVVVRPQRE